jgi:hypothetical protein
MVTSDKNRINPEKSPKIPDFQKNSLNYRLQEKSGFSGNQGRIRSRVGHKNIR